MLLEIGLLKKIKTKTKKQNKNKNKNKTKQKPKKKISTTKDVICCSKGYIYHFLDYITLLLK